MPEEKIKRGIRVYHNGDHGVEREQEEDRMHKTETNAQNETTRNENETKENAKQREAYL